MVVKVKKNISKKLFLLFFIGLFLPMLSYGDDAFDNLTFAIKNQATKIHFQELSRKYKGERIEGKGYVVNVNKNVDGETVVNLSTEKDPSSPKYVSIVVFVRDYFSEKTLKLKPGKYVRFFGNFDEIRMKTIIIREGIVK